MLKRSGASQEIQEIERKIRQYQAKIALQSASLKQMMRREREIDLKLAQQVKNDPFKLEILKLEYCICEFQGDCFYCKL